MRKTRWLKLLYIALALLILDIFSKYLIDAYLPLIERSAPFYPYGGLGIFKDIGGVELTIVHATNKGAAWGAFAQFQPYLMALRFVFVAVLLVYLVFINRQENLQIPLTLITAGATGNVLDFFIYGHVVDMIHFNLWGYHFPIFNVADSAIFIGVFCIFALTLFGSKQTVKSHSKRS